MFLKNALYEVWWLRCWHPKSTSISFRFLGHYLQSFRVFNQLQPVKRCELRMEFWNPQPHTHKYCRKNLVTLFRHPERPALFPRHGMASRFLRPTSPSNWGEAGWSMVRKQICNWNGYASNKNVSFQGVKCLVTSFASRLKSGMNFMVELLGCSRTMYTPLTVAMMTSSKARQQILSSAQKTN